MKIINGMVFGKDCKFTRRDVPIHGQQFAERSTDGLVYDAEGCYVVPGFVDIHTHGAMNYDFSDGNPEALEKISHFFATKGTTGFLATTMTLPEEVLTKAATTAGNFVPKDDQSTCLGIHLEGPFVCAAKKGAQAEEFLAKPDVAMFMRLQEASGDMVKLITMAPEVEGGMEFIEGVKDFCTVSLGHTAANYDTAFEAMECGVTHCTHMFNAMNSLHHRDPAVIGAAFDHEATAELICDGIHIHPSVIRMSHKMFGQRLVLVSDSLRCTGMPDGDYTLGGQPVIMKGGKCFLHDGTLAGSSICLHDSVLRSTGFGIPLEDVIYAATYAPAKAVRMEDVAGVIAPGRLADCVILNSDLSIKQVFLRGKPVL
ncbi:MAG: N-acetylglucosamine-6-phosphate deacetylase [Eubacteriales bacterium]